MGRVTADELRGWRYRDKHEQRLHLTATITPELLPVLGLNESDRPKGRSQINDIAGAGFEPATFGL